ncbi:DUF6600 domain-containing protein [Aromatoleum sp.]|uniref:DUF6600 domain-containing protein n=1 Tax=Aromatoleum sp. TaxID=2307007 RepID=UPI002FC5AE9C
MISHLRSWLALPLLIVLACAQAASSDPPSRVGRLSLLDGDVSMRREDSRRWEDASLNWPLTAGDEIATGADGLAEIRIGSTALRLGNRTAVDILRLDDERIRVRLDEGSVAVRVRSAEPAAAIEVETRHGAVIPVGPGQFRVDHDEATVSLTSYRGDLNFRSDDSDIIVTEGRRAHVYIADGTSVRWDDPADDDFAEWVLARDERDDALGAPRHVSPEMTGAEDLHEYGDWRTSDEYGEIWYPRDVPSGWAPYRSGRWVSVAPWGWTWVDDAPWGFAPFHYGRWVLLGHRWAWVPGRYVARPVYAPALVVWLGLPGVVVSSGPAHVGWFPLAPREIYLPSYRYTPSYVRRINITHVTNVVEITHVERDRRHARYAYRDHRDAVTLVRGDVLRDSRPVFRDAKRLDEGRWQLPRVATPLPPIDPVRKIGPDRGERSHEKDARSDRRPSPRERDDADDRRDRNRDRETTREPAVGSSVGAEDRRPARAESFGVRPMERRDDRRDHDRERRDAERRERIRASPQQDGLEPPPRQSQPEREQRLDPRRQHEQERRERDQQHMRQLQLQQNESRREAEALRRPEQRHIEPRSREDLQQRTDELRRQQERRDHTQRQFEQQRRRDVQDRQRFAEQQREHERDRREQRQAIGQQRELRREQQRLDPQQSRQEREARRPDGRQDGETSRGRP